MIIFLSLINLLFIPDITAGSCNCWGAWSQCSATCGGGIQTRRSGTSLLSYDCIGFTYCGLDRRNCNTNCYNGGRYLNGGCSCPNGVKGSCCEQTVNCGRPSSISNGGFIGNDFTYTHQVRYTCNEKYNMSDPSAASMTCTEDGYWSGSSPVCLYAVSCESNPCKNAAHCVNLLGDYKCNCNLGWSGKNCEVDIQPPVVLDCPSHRHILASDMTSKQNWSEPKITDPHGKVVHITKNYPKSSFEFPWGEFTVQYNAVKPCNGLAAECIFNISVKPYPCKKMNPPINGLIACNGWRSDYAQVCIFLCKDGFILPPGHQSEDIYNCGATGNWLPPFPVLQCVSKDLFSKTPSQTSKPVSFSTCMNATERLRISQFYIASIQKSPFNELCLNHAAECKADNVDARC